MTTYYHTIPPHEPDPFLVLAALLLYSEEADALVLGGLPEEDEDRV